MFIENKVIREIGMKAVVAFIFIIGILFNVCSAQEKPELKDQKERESYSLS